MFKQFSIISVLILMFTIVANANNVNLLKNAEDTDQQKSGISKSLFISDLTKLSICASLQKNNETIFSSKKDGFHVHSSQHAEPVLNDISSWIESLYSKSFIDNMSKKSQIKLGQILYSFNENDKRKPPEVFCMATGEKEPCEINSVKTLELSCVRSLIKVHIKYSPHTCALGPAGIIHPDLLNSHILSPTEPCRPAALQNPFASHHENEKKLKELIENMNKDQSISNVFWKH